MFSSVHRIVLSCLLVIALLVFNKEGSAECPNACSSHGKCGEYDACECYRNWMANDCSERVCQFGLAHVDSPKGDLDASSGELYSPEALNDSSNSLSMNDPRVAQPVIVGSTMYPQGTVEKYPQMVNTLSQIIPNTAHDYMECSNKGICDRARGVCECFQGYEGSSCQRAACPDSNEGFCNGHGTCMPIKTIAGLDYSNQYELWDEYTSMGCVCDAGYYGADCSLSKCKYGIDPIYAEYNERTTRFSNFTFVIWNIDSRDAALEVIDRSTDPIFVTNSTRKTWNGTAWRNDTLSKNITSWNGTHWNNYTQIRNISVPIFGVESVHKSVFNPKSLNAPKFLRTKRRAKWSGNYSIVFYDIFGQDWHTNPISIDGECSDIVSALESLPNDVIKPGYVRCSLDKSNFGTYLFDEGVSSIATNTTHPVGGIPDGFPIDLGSSYLRNDGDYGPFVATKFTLAFPHNPGKLRQPNINMYLDGNRRTLSTGVRETTKPASVATEPRSWIYANGFTGEYIDFAPDLCLNVKITLKVITGTLTPFVSTVTENATWGQFDGLSRAEIRLLKRCLGDSDGDHTNNAMYKATDSQDHTYDWDYGITTDMHSNFTKETWRYNSTELINPHLVKLVDTSTSSVTKLCDTSHHLRDLFYTEMGYCPQENPAGFYVVVYFDPLTSNFRFLSRAWQDFDRTTTFHVFTSRGHLQLASHKTDVYTNYLPYQLNSTIVKADGTLDLELITRDLTSYYNNVVYTWSETGTRHVDCETVAKDDTDIYQCLEKGDWVMIFDTDFETDEKISRNPKYHNIYQIMKISRENRNDVPDADDHYRYQIVLDTGMNARYTKVGTQSSGAKIYKFYPPTEEVVQYVGPCSMRGICNKNNGQCDCFSGYDGDDCSGINAPTM